MSGVRSGKQSAMVALFTLMVWLLVTAQMAASTVVSGLITTNTTWYQAQSPYIASGDITVSTGVTLTIEPGVTVLFRQVDNPKTYTRRAVLRVMGSLEARGSALAPITFTLAEGSAIGDWGGLWLDGNGAAVLEHVRIMYAERGIYAAGSVLQLSNSTVVWNLTGIYLEGGQGHNIAENDISFNEYGVFCRQASGAVEYNRFNSNSWGLYSETEQGLLISRNDFKSNTFAIMHNGGTQAQITENDFSIDRANDYALLVRSECPAIVTRNNFFYEPELAITPGGVFWYIFNDSAADIIAPDNWWDTVDNTVIDAYTYDGRDDASRGLVRYTPLATTPWSNTAGIYPLTVDVKVSAAFSPNDDGIQDICAINYTVSKEATVALEVVEEGVGGSAGTVMWRQEEGVRQPGVQHNAWWDGRLLNGVAPDGRYHVQVVATAAGEEAVASAEVMLDTQPPKMNLATPLPSGTVYVAEVTTAGSIWDALVAPEYLKMEFNGYLLPLQFASEQAEFAIQHLLRPGTQELTVKGCDPAGNLVELSNVVTYVPLLTFSLPSITSDAQLSVTGEVHSDAVHSVCVVFSDAQGGMQTLDAQLQADSPRTFTLVTPLEMAVGVNHISAKGYDVSGEMLCSSVAEVEYNPFYNKSLTYTFPPGTSLISLPLTPLESDLPSALMLPPTGFRLARWQVTADSAGYVHYNEANLLEAAEPGRGYWLRLEPDVFPQGHTGQVEGNLVNTGSGCPIPLVRGWNLIGHPFLEAVPWADVQVQTDAGTVDWASAVGNGWLHAELWGYVGSVGAGVGVSDAGGSANNIGGYRMQTMLTPWQGYWVKATRPLTLIIPPPTQTIKAGAISSVTSSNMQVATSRPLEPIWRLQLVASCSSSIDIDNFIGEAQGASDGRDAFWDWEEPPAIDEGVMLSFLSDGPLLAADIRGPMESTDKRRWTFIVQSTGNEQVRLTWPNLAQVAAGRQFTLVDEVAGIQVPLQVGADYNYQPQRTGEMRVFRLEVAVAASSLLQGLMVYPNPWNGQGPLRISIQLAAAAEVSINICDASGRLLRRLYATADAAGTIVVPWDGRVGNLPAPNGLYTVKASVRSGGRANTLSDRFVIWR